MGVTYRGFDEIASKLNQAAQEAPVNGDKFLEQEAETVMGRVKDLTPVRTGMLKGGETGWKRTEPERGSIDVYNNTKYASHVEYGHRTRNGGFVKGQKMLLKGLAQSYLSFQEDAGQILKELIK